MGRIANRQKVRAAVSAKEMVAEYHEHWDWYDEDLDAFDREDDGDRYVFPSSSDENPMVADNYDYLDWGEDFFLPMDYHHEHYLETTYHP